MTSGPGVASAEVGVTIRYWASARAAAGCDSESFTGRHVGDVLEAAAAAHTGLRVVLDVSTILLDGRPVKASDPLPRTVPGPGSEGTVGTIGTIIEVLPPFAGG
jgi:hypothetical protein